MAEERRAFNALPDYLKTPTNNREMFVVDDVMFEPEQAEFLNGYIGDTIGLDAIDLARKPAIVERNSLSQKRQLSLGAVFIDPNTGLYSGGAFYDDLASQISSNGGIVSDPTKIFDTNYYVWTPPIDYDKHINFSRYFWIGNGDALSHGDYITKEPQGSHTVIYQYNGTAFTPFPVTISTVSPTSPLLNALWEDASTSNRLIYKWDGATWNPVTFSISYDIPTSGTIGDYAYVLRSGFNFNMFTIWQYSLPAGRWLSRPVITGPTPDSPSEGMIWEDTTISPNRVFKIYTNGAFVPLVWSSGTPSGIPTTVEYRYDTRPPNVDAWSESNYWRHFNDLSPIDRSYLTSKHQATRPIVEFWAGIEINPNIQHTSKNTEPSFGVYYIDSTTYQIAPTNTVSSIFQYQHGTGDVDVVLGFPLVYNATGEFQFEATIETDIIANIKGYRYYKDIFTGVYHGIWEKASTKLLPVIDANGNTDIPKTISANPNHETPTVMSRSKLLPHMSANIKAQVSFIGNAFGVNTYRWSDKNFEIGHTIIDCENSLLRVLSTFQKDHLEIPNIIRETGRRYDKTLAKFSMKMNQMWMSGAIIDINDNIYGTIADAVDIILTSIFVGRGVDFPYYHSGMGTYTEKLISNGIISIVNSIPSPIFIPSSAPRIGATHTYKPEKFVHLGNTYIQNHDGSRIFSFGDARDDIWIELQNRFYNAIPNYYKDETVSFSASHTPSNFIVNRYYGNSIPNVVHSVSSVVSDYTSIVMVAGQRVLDQASTSIIYYDGSHHLQTSIMVDDIIKDALGDYYTYNGLGIFKIALWNKPYTYDFSMEQYHQIMRREFERWGAATNIDFITNTTYNNNDKFTWNYRSAGVEGNYAGIYTRLYNTYRPHSHPWEIIGYSIEPSWWETTYTRDATAIDGTPRYFSANPMWTDFANGVIDGSTVDLLYQMVAPIPVDNVGKLLDPIASGVIDIANLDMSRINADWLYGDGSPKYQEFMASNVYAFSLALLGYLTKPGTFVESLWSELYVDVGHIGANTVFNAPIVVHRDTMNRPSTSVLTMHLEIDPTGNVIVKNGLNAWISEFVASLGKDVKTHFGDTIRNTNVSLSWKCAGFVNAARTVVSTLSGYKIPYEDVHTTTHRSMPISEHFGSGVLVIREGQGYRVYGYDLFNPYFNIDMPSNSTKATLIETKENLTATANQLTFTANANIVDGSYSILINGMKVDPKFITTTTVHTFSIDPVVAINNGDTITVTMLSTNTSGTQRVKQFVEAGVSFPYLDIGSGVLQRVEYGRYYQTATDVINFMLGYGRALKSEGWLFGADTGITGAYDWMTGVRAFGRWVVDSTTWKDVPTVPPAFFFTPFNKVASFSSTFGQVLNVESVHNGAFGILDSDAKPIDPALVTVSRVENAIIMETSETTPSIYGIRLQIVEDQHVVFFSNITKFNDIIYDPVDEKAQRVLAIEAYRSSNWNGRARAAGFVLADNTMLPNLEKKTKDITKYYNNSNLIDDPTKRDLARELYGWYNNDNHIDTNGIITPMMSALGADDRVKFDFHRGMIHQKGTIKPIIAFSRGTRLGQNNVSITEDWAWKIADFGDTRKENVQFTVNKNDFRSKLQHIKFNVPEDITTTILEIPAFDRGITTNPRWEIPPLREVNNIASQYLLNTLTGTIGEPTVAVKLFDPRRVLTQTYYHFDPLAGNLLNDPTALSEIDYISDIDPAVYNDGVETLVSGSNWASANVGEFWWDISRVKYRDYKGVHPDYNAMMRDWGKLEYFVATISRVNETVTVSFSDPHTNLPASHHLADGDLIAISGADQLDYNLEIAVTVVNATDISFVTNGLPVTPATGNIIVKTGFINILEWVESSVPPSAWDSIKTHVPTNITNGTPYNNSYTQVTSYDHNANISIKYYFWVKSNTGINPTKTLRADEVTTRLSSPSSYGLAWFGIADTENLFVANGVLAVEDASTMEIAVDNSTAMMHTEWVIISEEDTFNVVPPEIMDKMVDSLSGQDVLGNPVPNIQMTLSEKYGTDTYPPQTVFADRAAAISSFVTKANEILASYNMKFVADILYQFPLTAVGTYWDKHSYRDVAYKSPAFSVVADIASRDALLLSAMYADGDIVYVLNSAHNDLWDATPIASTYVLSNGAFIEIGIDNHTVQINLTISDTAFTIRDVFARVMQVIPKAAQNQLISALIREMMRQHENVDWCIKTSYISVRVTDTVSTASYVRPSESDAIFASINEYKPYRTKIRSGVSTHIVGQIDNVSLTVTDFPEQKITVILDRLNCNLEDENGWDHSAWDLDPYGYDTPIWETLNQGLDHWISSPLIAGVINTSVYDVPAIGDLRKYNNRVTMYFNGAPYDMAANGLTAVITDNGSSTLVTFNTSLSVEFTFTVDQTASFYDGNVPTISTPFTPYTSTFKHHIARLESMGYTAPFPSFAGCAVGQTPEERIPTVVADSFVVAVKSDWTDAYKAWDNAPFDVSGWDSNTANVGRRTFFILGGQEKKLPIGVEFLPTSETIALHTPNTAIRLYNHKISRVEYNGNILLNNVDYTFDNRTGTFTFLSYGGITYVADGIDKIFSTASFNYPVKDVFRNGILQPLGTTYNIVGSDVKFVQPAPTISANVAYLKNTHYIASGSTTYAASVPINSANVENMLIFINGGLVNRADYSIDSFGNVVFGTAPSGGSQILISAFGNDFGNSTAFMSTFNTIGDSTTTQFIIGNNATPDTTYVFVDGVYKQVTVDFTMTINGIVDFIIPPAIGSIVDIRSFIGGAYVSIDQTVTRTTTNGTTSTAMIGIADADPVSMLIFKNGLLLDSYNSPSDFLLINGNPDVINWPIAEAAGQNVVIRMMRFVTLGTNSVQPVIPSAGDVIRITQTSPWAIGEQLTVYYQEFDVGNQKNITVQSVPTTYDISYGVLTLDNPVLNDAVRIRFNTERRGTNSLGMVVRMPIIVDEFLPDHLIYDATGSIETNRRVGKRVLNTTINAIFVWNGTAWTNTGTVFAINDLVLALLNQKILKYNGTIFITDYSAGDVGYPLPPVFGYPIYGDGVTSATYLFGQLPTANVDYKEAYNIMQNAGDYW